MARPRKHETRNDRAVVFADKKIESGSKQIGVYLDSEAIGTLETIKTITGLGNTALFNAIFHSARFKIDQFMALIEFSEDSQKKAISALQDRLDAAKNAFDVDPVDAGEIDDIEFGSK